MNTKGISPLIATIFLIAVAVALGSIVMSLGQDYVGQADINGGIGFDVCDGISYQVKAIRYADSEARVEVVVDNSDVKLDGFLFKFFSSDFSQAYTDQVTQEINSYDVGILKLAIDNDQLSELGSVTLVPLRRLGSNYEPCDDNAKEFNSDFFSSI